MTSTALEVRRSMPVNSMADATQLAKAFAQAHVMGAQNDPEGMLVVALIREIGLVQAEANYHVMQGRISKKASAVASDFIKLGGKYQVLERSPEICRVKASYGETKDIEMSFSWEQAMQEPFVYSGGEDKQFKQLALPVEERTLRAKYRTPRSRMQMLWARLMSDMVTTLCPEARDGMYTPEEVADFTPERPSDTAAIDTEEVQQRLNAQEEERIDYTLCPFEGACKGKPWKEFRTDQLERCLVAKLDGFTTTHAAAVRLVLEERKEEAK